VGGVPVGDAAPLLRGRDVVGDGGANDRDDHFVREHVEGLDGARRILRKLHGGDRGAAARGGERPPFAVEWQREQDLAPRLLRVAEEPPELRRVGVAPERLDCRERRALRALRAGPVLTVEAVILLGERLHEDANPLPIRGGRERRREQRDVERTFLAAGRAGLAFHVKEQVDGATKLVE
jgi:hypothetical protein